MLYIRSVQVASKKGVSCGSCRRHPYVSVSVACTYRTSSAGWHLGGVVAKDIVAYVAERKGVAKMLEYCASENRKNGWNSIYC